MNLRSIIFALFIGFAVGLAVAAERTEPAHLTREQIAAAAGDADAQRRLGERFLKGEGVKPDSREAARLFLSAAQAGDPQAAIALSDLYAAGTGVRRDVEASMRWLLTAHKAKLPAAEHRLGKLYRDGQLAATVYRAALEQWEIAPGVPGYLDAALGDHYAGPKRDLVRAAVWYRRAAEADVPEAQVALGKMLWEGKEVERDILEAAGLFLRAADHPVYQQDIFWTKLAPLPEIEAGLSMLASYADVGHPAATRFIKVFCEQPAAVAPCAAAASRLTEAARIGSVDQKLRVSRLYAAGRLVPADLAESFRWQLLAAGANEEQLMALMRVMDRRPAVRTAACREWSETSLSPWTVMALRQAAGDGEASVRQAALEGLRRHRVDVVDAKDYAAFASAFKIGHMPVRYSGMTDPAAHAFSTQARQVLRLFGLSKMDNLRPLTRFHLNSQIDGFTVSDGSSVYVLFAAREGRVPHYAADSPVLLHRIDHEGHEILESWLTLTDDDRPLLLRRSSASGRFHYDSVDFDKQGFPTGAALDAIVAKGRYIALDKSQASR